MSGEGKGTNRDRNLILKGSYRQHESDFLTKGVLDRGGGLLVEKRNNSVDLGGGFPEVVRDVVRKSQNGRRKTLGGRRGGRLVKRQEEAIITFN